MVSYQSNSWNQKVDKFEDYLKNEGIPKLSKDKKWYIWMIHQRIYYHRNEYHLKHDDNRKRWEDLCKKYNASTIIRGLRAVSDFEYEFQLAGMNKKLNSKIETMFLMSDVENQIISSKFVKEIANLGGNIDRFVTRSTVKMLRNRN